MPPFYSNIQVPDSRDSPSTRSVVIHDLIEKEKRRQCRRIELIASKNFTFFAVIEALDSALTNKYSDPTSSWKIHATLNCISFVLPKTPIRLSDLNSVKANYKMDFPEKPLTNRPHTDTLQLSPRRVHLKSSEQ